MSKRPSSPNILDERVSKRARPSSPQKKRRRRKRKIPLVTPLSAVPTAPGKVKQNHVSDTLVDPQTILISQLKNQIRVKDATIQSHETLLAQAQQSLTCQICLNLLHRPFSLAPCGHVACHSCLTSWFTVSPDPPADFYTRKKTCPQCRVIVKDRPAEVWIIKSLVNGLIQSNLIPNSAEIVHPDATLEESGQDPWYKIFRPVTVIKGMHTQNFSIEDMGMLDLEDGGIYRCLDCFHEISGGICSSCGRQYRGHNDDLSDDGSIDYLLGGDTMSDDNDGEINLFGMNPLHFFPAFGFAEETDNDSDSQSRILEVMSEPESVQSADEEYDGSFIDDDVDVHTERLSDGAVATRASPLGRVAHISYEDENNDSELDDDFESANTIAHRRPSHRHVQSVDIMEISSSANSDTEAPTWRRGTRRRISSGSVTHDSDGAEAIIENSEDSDGDSDDFVVHIRRPNGGRRPNIYLGSEDEDSDQ